MIVILICGVAVIASAVAWHMDQAYRRAVERRNKAAEVDAEAQRLLDTLDGKEDGS